VPGPPAACRCWTPSTCAPTSEPPATARLPPDAGASPQTFVRRADSCGTEPSPPPCEAPPGGGAALESRSAGRVGGVLRTGLGASPLRPGRLRGGGAHADAGQPAGAAGLAWAPQELTLTSTGRSRRSGVVQCGLGNCCHSIALRRQAGGLFDAGFSRDGRKLLATGQAGKARLRLPHTVSDSCLCRSCSGTCALHARRVQQWPHRAPPAPCCRCSWRMATWLCMLAASGVSSSAGIFAADDKQRHSWPPHRHVAAGRAAAMRA